LHFPTLFESPLYLNFLQLTRVPDRYLFLCDICHELAREVNMCWSCNPYCGGCKPPQPRPRKCEGCGKFNFDPQEKLCKKCGRPLPEIIPPAIVMCLYVGELCANPCRRHKNTPEDGKLKSCNYRTAPEQDVHSGNQSK